MINLPILMVFLPLFSSLFSVLFKKSFFVESITVIGIAVSTILSWYIFFIFPQNYYLNLFPLFSIDTLKVNFAINIDPLSSLMLIIITTISLIVHVYSIGYMKYDNGKFRFFSYLSLFTFCMIFLVVSDNFIQLFFSWEGVGLFSYLLIGFWFQKYSANNAAFKAFIINRIGDLILLIAIFFIYYSFNSLKFDVIFNKSNFIIEQNIKIFSFKLKSIHLICILIFLGSMGKSAQFGLHTWLPDAMEGPTPASALIHSATMVTSGIFLVAKCSPLFEMSNITRELILIIGSITAFFAATVAIFQSNIKKIIAYSTCSQLGYMFIACGLSSYNIAIFHLMTHAFFKSLLFLTIGNVTYLMSNEQNIYKMINCWKRIPCTYILTWIGFLSLSGIFPFSGFYSKDLIIEYAYNSKNNFVFIISLVTALLTPIYSIRLLFFTFHNKRKQNKINNIRIPKIMILPLTILAFGSIFSGILGINILNITSNIFWKSSLIITSNNESSNYFFMKLLTNLISIIIISITLIFYYYDKKIKKNNFLIKFLQNKWYFDEIYNFIIVMPVKFVSEFLSKFDTQVIDSLGTNGLVNLINKCSERFIKLQTGYIFDYVFIIFFALVIYTLYIIGIK